MLRAYDHKDLEQALDIWLTTTSKAHDFVDEGFWKSKVSDMRERFLPSGENYVYEKNGEVVGFVCLVANRLVALFVRPGFQSKGIGSELMAKAKEVRSEMTLRAFKSNPRCISFYEKHGFNREKEQLDAFTGRPEVVMNWSA